MKNVFILAFLFSLINISTSRTTYILSRTTIIDEQSTIDPITGKQKINVIFITYSISKSFLEFSMRLKDYDYGTYTNATCFCNGTKYEGEGIILNHQANYIHR